MKGKGISVPGPSLRNQVSFCGSSPANEALKRHTEILRREYLSLVESSYRAAAVLDVEGTVVRCNELFDRVLGLEEGGAKGKNFFHFLDGEEGARLNASFRELCQRAGYSLLASFRLLCGADLAFNAAALLRNMADHPEIGGIVLEILDISGCARAKRTLDEINRLFCRLGPDSVENFGTIASAVRGLFEADSCCYFRWEKDRLQVYPSPGALLGENLVDPSGRFLAMQLLRRGADEPLYIADLTAREELLEDPVARAMGARTFYGQPVMHAGKTSGALCLYHKTPRLYTRDEKDSLNLLARFISLEEAHRQHEMSLRDLIDVVSHELRHPISIIIGYAHTLKSHRERLDQRTLEEILERIENGAKRLEHTVSEILEVSKLEKGMLVMRKEETDLRAILERAMEEMRAKGVKNPLYVKADDVLPPVSADPKKILKVLIIQVMHHLGGEFGSQDEHDDGGLFSVGNAVGTHSHQSVSSRSQLLIRRATASGRVSAIFRI
ncbi:MAG: GAF domain-containing protein [Fimbriimonadales bacterium]|nr:GAF domain-containing protein [Fimbriimonadales bacterium]